MEEVALTVGWASFEATKFACLNWHYAKVLPTGRLTRVGAWENDEFVGVVVFGRGAAAQLGQPYGLDATEVCELVRVALRNGHRTPVSQIVAAALRMLKELNPGLRLVVSFADSGQGHHGGIYQAGNWVYAGDTGKGAQWYRVNGRVMHGKVLHERYGVGGQSVPWLRANVDPNAERVPMPPKHRYLMPLDRGMRRRVAKLAQPYPERAAG